MSIHDVRQRARDSLAPFEALAIVEEYGRRAGSAIVRFRHRHTPDPQTPPTRRPRQLVDGVWHIPLANAASLRDIAAGSGEAIRASGGWLTLHVGPVRYCARSRS